MRACFRHTCIRCTFACSFPAEDSDCPVRIVAGTRHVRPVRNADGDHDDDDRDVDRIVVRGVGIRSVRTVAWDSCSREEVEYPQDRSDPSEARRIRILRKTGDGHAHTDKSRIRDDARIRGDENAPRVLPRTDPWEEVRIDGDDDDAGNADRSRQGPRQAQSRPPHRSPPGLQHRAPRPVRRSHRPLAYRRPRVVQIRHCLRRLRTRENPDSSDRIRYPGPWPTRSDRDRALLTASRDGDDDVGDEILREIRNQAFERAKRCTRPNC